LYEKIQIAAIMQGVTKRFGDLADLTTCLVPYSWLLLELYDWNIHSQSKNKKVFSYAAGL